jgi:peptidoglycan/LPS O-acetylase OafA/YrhL
MAKLVSELPAQGGSRIDARAASVSAARKPVRRLDIQGLRGVAVLMVVLFHSGLSVSGGFTGVDVFYVISGFVITGVLLSDLTTLDRIRLGAFYARRVRRLLPALALVVAFVAVVGIVASPAGSQRTGALTGIFASLFTANVYLYRLGAGYFDVSTSLNPLLHTWTLAVEEQFYLLFPAILFLTWRATRRMAENRKRLIAAAVVGLVSIISFLISLVLSGGHAIPGVGLPQRLAFYGSPSRAWEFGAGAMLALLVPWAVRLSRKYAEALAVAGLAAVATGALAIEGTQHYPGTAALLPVVGTSALILAGTGTQGRVSRLLSHRSIAWIGDLSYSWYLWHWPLIVFAGAMWPNSAAAPRIAAAISLFPAWASYRYVENPIRRDPRFRGRAVLALGGLCLAVPLAASAGLLGANRAILHTAAMKSWERSQRKHEDQLLGCNRPIPLDQRKGCTWRTPRSRGQLLLIGDSNAGHFTEPFLAAAKRARFDATVATLASCPFVDTHVLGGFSGEGPCRRFYDGAIAEITRNPPSLVVAAALTTGYIEKPEIKLRTDKGQVLTDADSKAALWQQQLSSTLARLNQMGIPVVVVDPVPTFPYTPEECAVVRVLARSCESSLPRTEVDKHQRRALHAEEVAVAGSANGSRLDLTNEFCDASRCSTMRGPLMMYRNTNHLSVDGALTLTRRFYAAIVAHARPRHKAGES